MRPFPLLAGLAAAVFVASLSHSGAAEPAGKGQAPPSPDPSHARSVPSGHETEFAGFVTTYCASCHGGVSQKSELNLEPYAADLATLRADADLMESLRDELAEQGMPPRKAEKKLGDAERARMVAWLDAALHRARQANLNDPGLVIMPRLTPMEYRNVVRDLSGGVVTAAGQFLPNEGGAGEGFANVGEAQSMTPAQFEKYVEAAKLALRHLRAYPSAGLVWRPVQRDPVDEPAKARAEAINDIINWHVRQQEAWNNQHKEDLQHRLGIVHAAYLEACWQYRWRKELGNPTATLADVARGYEVPLSLVALEKWWDILSAEQPPDPFAAWGKAWKALPHPATAGPHGVRQACREIELGKALPVDTFDFGPSYELSWQDAERRKETLAAAREGRWPFDIEIGDAKELFLIFTDAGDGGNDLARWRNGRFVYADGSTRPWQDVVKIIGANSGKPYKFGFDANNKTATPDALGSKAPGAFKFAVPENAVRFEVELVLDRQKNPKATVQALVLYEKPRGRGSFYPGRMIFGGGTPKAGRGEAGNKDLERALRRRNVSEANRTKIGLNAERNVFEDWAACDVKYLGGPWPTHDPDKEEPLFPYHYTVKQVRRVATPEALAELEELRSRLASVVQVPHQDLYRALLAGGHDEAHEGVQPSAEVMSRLDPSARRAVERATADVQKHERELEVRAAEIIRPFATRAWRRPVTDAEHDLLLHLYRDGRAMGLSFDGAMKQPLLAVFVSPHFLYRSPRDATAGAEPGAETRPLTGYELASRLSFFLWASLPDEELLRLAADGTLTDPAVLKAQTRRMLADERSRSLATDFAAQMLRFGDFEHFAGPDGKRFAEFTPALRQAMFDEVVAFFDDLVRNDRPLTNIIRADYTFVTPELAKHYGLPVPEPSPDGRPVRVRVSDQRGGILGMGLFLTQHSLPLRTSPVQRGVWILENLLGREMPVPPPVPPLSEDETNADGLSIREQLEKHRADPSCARCHDKIDPLGIALENFDPIGRWRTETRDGSPLASSATSHDGVNLDGFAGLRNYLDGSRDEMFANFSRKMLGYALGRSVGPGDAELLSQINQDLKSGGYRLSILVDGIVTSPQFLSRRVSATGQPAGSRR